MADAELLWAWANDGETRRHAFSKAPIPFTEHLEWLERRLGSADTRIWIFSDETGPVGQVRFDVAGGQAEVDISVAPERRGRGLGQAMLAQALRRLRAEYGEGAPCPTAQVLEGNARSLRLFKACGFEQIAVVDRGGARAVVLTRAADAAEA